MLLYKMHACVQHPDSMLITTYDYVRYIAMWRDKRAGMATEFRDLLLKRVFALHVLARCTALADETLNRIRVLRGGFTGSSMGEDDGVAMPRGNRAGETSPGIRCTAKARRRFRFQNFRHAGPRRRVLNADAARPSSSGG